MGNITVIPLVVMLGQKDISKTIMLGIYVHAIHSSIKHYILNFRFTKLNENLFK